MIDFDAEWASLQEASARPDDAAGWNRRAPRYDSVGATNQYAEDFLALAHIAPGERVLDMGCGTGVLSMPLAQAGCAVIAADFSDGMLAQLRENARARGVALAGVQDALRAPGPSAATVAPVLMSWEDDWRAFGLGEDVVDVAVASRSISVADLHAALRKLSWAARRRCCITMTTGVSPRVDPAVLSAIDVPMSLGRDYLYAFGMLAQAGFEPEVRYIRSPRKDTFNSLDEALEDFSRMIDHGAAPLSPSERQAAVGRMREWLAAHMVDNPEAGKLDRKGRPQGAFALDHERIVPWAFISWDPKAAKL